MMTREETDVELINCNLQKCCRRDGLSHLTDTHLRGPSSLPALQIPSHLAHTFVKGLFTKSPQATTLICFLLFPLSA